VRRSIQTIQLLHMLLSAMVKEGEGLAKIKRRTCST